MKKPIPWLTVALAAALLAGCAASDELRAPTEVDTRYVATIERSAKQVGVDVVWVNPPRRARSDDDG
ncbi:MAG: lipoprotein [Gammaproteobacteria bacterium]|jgi:type IV pilus biogenesis protein CpaD/CtpE|nr:lipoprotein [Gammaproteobacteria bacterium]